MSSKRSHARYSPSMLSSLQKCLRFRYSDVNEDAAAEGTALHSAAESEDLTGLDEEQRRSVQNTIDYVETLKEGKPEDWYHLKECRVALEDLTFGTADVILVHRTEPRAHVVDHKFTRLEGDHELQLNTYAAGLVESITQCRDLLDHDGRILLKSSDVKQGIQIVSTHVVAPRTYTIDVHTYVAAELLVNVRKEISDLYERIDDPFLPPTPSEALCRLCARASRCPAMAQVAVTTARGIGLPVPSTFSPAALVAPEDRAKAHIIAQALENWAEAIKKNNNMYAQNGGEIPGFTLRSRSTGVRLPKEYTGVGMDILKQAGYPEDMLLESCSLTLGTLAKAKAERFDAPEAEVKEELRTLLADYTTEGQTSFLAKSKKVSDTDLLKQLSMGGV